MEEEKNNKYKKETSCLFYNFKINKKATPILTNIDDKKKKISDIYSNIDNYYGKKILTENDDFSKDSYGYYRHIFSKFLVSKLITCFISSIILSLLISIRFCNISKFILFSS